ncbi:hypothetical protein HPB47_009348 [Ixodes persulcatus]|uniref:Uncharacterized protein n=1 Tax=Ixodes persulcatus TaxID=34615 RepID=A0AC60P267_IXOPE|nr:hypothetical protein HPB47_009348 [Ixodes persulcatus]
MAVIWMIVVEQRYEAGLATPAWEVGDWRLLRPLLQRRWLSPSRTRNPGGAAAEAWNSCAAPRCSQPTETLT